MRFSSTSVCETLTDSYFFNNIFPPFISYPHNATVKIPSGYFDYNYLNIPAYEPYMTGYISNNILYSGSPSNFSLQNYHPKYLTFVLTPSINLDSHNYHLHNHKAFLYPDINLYRPPDLRWNWSTRLPASGTKINHLMKQKHIAGAKGTYYDPNNLYWKRYDYIDQVVFVTSGDIVEIFDDYVLTYDSETVITDYSYRNNAESGIPVWVFKRQSYKKNEDDIDIYMYVDKQAYELNTSKQLKIQRLDILHSGVLWYQLYYKPNLDINQQTGNYSSGIFVFPTRKKSRFNDNPMCTTYCLFETPPQFRLFQTALPFVFNDSDYNRKINVTDTIEFIRPDVRNVQGFEYNLKLYKLSGVNEFYTNCTRDIYLKSIPESFSLDLSLAIDVADVYGFDGFGGYSILQSTGAIIDGYWLPLKLYNPIDDPLNVSETEYSYNILSNRRWDYSFMIWSGIYQTTIPETVSRFTASDANATETFNRPVTIGCSIIYGMYQIPNQPYWDGTTCDNAQTIRYKCDVYFSGGGGAYVQTSGGNFDGYGGRYISSSGIPANYNYGYNSDYFFHAPVYQLNSTYSYLTSNNVTTTISAPLPYNYGMSAFSIDRQTVRHKIFKYSDIEYTERHTASTFGSIGSGLFDKTIKTPIDYGSPHRDLSISHNDLCPSYTNSAIFGSHGTSISQPELIFFDKELFTKKDIPFPISEGGDIHFLSTSGYAVVGVFIYSNVTYRSPEYYQLQDLLSIYSNRSLDIIAVQRFAYQEARIYTSGTIYQYVDGILTAVDLQLYTLPEYGEGYGDLNLLENLYGLGVIARDNKISISWA